MNVIHVRSSKLFRHMPCVVLVLCLSLISGCMWLKPDSPAVEPGEGRPEEILSHEEDALQKAYSYFAMASYHEENGQLEEARDYVLKAIQKDPDSAYLYKKMAVLLRRLKDYEEATAYAQKAVNLSPESMDYRSLLAELYALSKQDDAAMEEYRKILDLDPKQQPNRIWTGSLRTIRIR